MGCGREATEQDLVMTKSQDGGRVRAYVSRPNYHRIISRSGTCRGLVALAVSLELN